MMKKWFVFPFCALALMAFSVATGPSGYEIGDQAADFSLKGTDGEMHTLAGMPNAQGYIVIFSCNHCPYVLAYEDRMIALHNKYAPLGYPVVAINPNDKKIQPADSYEKMVERARDKAFPFAYLYDETQEVAKAFGATRTPHVYLLDQNRVVRYIGAIDDNSEDPEAVSERYLENALEALREGRTPDPAQTKAIGCTIKWKKN